MRRVAYVIGAMFRPRIATLMAVVALTGFMLGAERLKSRWRYYGERADYYAKVRKQSELSVEYVKHASHQCRTSADQLRQKMRLSVKAGDQHIRYLQSLLDGLEKEAAMRDRELEQFTKEAKEATQREKYFRHRVW